MEEQAISYSLAVFDGVQITGVRQLTYEQYNEYTGYIKALIGYSTDQNLYRLTEMNYDELISNLERHKQWYIENKQGIDHKILGRIHLDINRVILNFLSSVRTYLDHTETRLKRKYGETSEQYKLFQTATAHSFDNHFAYRFLSKVRNFSQHCGLPSGSVELSSIVDAEGKTVNTMNVFFVRDHLLKEYDGWGAIVKPELGNMPEQFDVFPLIEEKCKLIKEINMKVAVKELEQHTTAGTTLFNLMIETQNAGGAPCILDIRGTRDNPKVGFAWFPYDIISAITGLEIEVVQPPHQQTARPPA